MVNFHLRRNLLVALLIIVPIGIVWLLITLFSAVLTPEEEVEAEAAKVSKVTSYIEKIDNFSLQAFNSKQQLAHLIQAKNYFNFKQAPALLIDPVVIAYNEKGEQIYTMTSKRANYLDNGEVKFKGKVDINSKTGAVYNMHTKALTANTQTSDLLSNEAVTYLDKTAKVLAQGMHMMTKQDKMRLLGKTSINQDSGQRILTRDLMIDQSNAQKRYYSKNDTSYTAHGNKIHAQGIDMDMNKATVALLNTVEILQKSGAKINTKNLNIDQSDNKEIYSTKEKVHYQSQTANIYATGMLFNAKEQKIKLTGGVTGRYE